MLVSLVNVWDAASARAVAAQPRCQAVATASAAIAAAHGYPDGQRIPAELMLAAVAPIAAAIDLPVTADLESGYGDVDTTIRRARFTAVTDPERCSVVLVTVDEVVLEQLVQAATTDAAADEVTPPLTVGPDWTAARVQWLKDFHRARRAGLAGAAGEATWAVIAARRVVGSVRLKRTGEHGVLETGAWLTRTARGRGIGTAAITALLEQAVELDAQHVRADTTAGNLGAIRVLQRLGFELTRDDHDVRALLRLDTAALGPQPR